MLKSRLKQLVIGTAAILALMGAGAAAWIALAMAPTGAVTAAAVTSSTTPTPTATPSAHGVNCPNMGQSSSVSGSSATT